MEMHDRILNAMVDVAEEAGEVLFKYFCDGMNQAGLSTKEDGQLVTDADRESNALILSRLTGSFPEIPVLTEEGIDDLKRLRSHSLFVVDPLDGTNNFIAGENDFAVSIAYTEGDAAQHRPLIGVVYRPVSGELFIAQKGNGAKLIREKREFKLTVSKQADWFNARLVCSAWRKDALTARLKSLSPSTLGQGSAALMVCKVAMGEAEWYGHVAPRHLSEYDIAAADLILSEAGGKLTDALGNLVRYNRPGTALARGIVASNGFLHHDVVQAVSAILVSGVGLSAAEKIREAA
jgi:3'(2'),5'-bisphosphate nucleotidase